jgi:hypothetical protein
VRDIRVNTDWASGGLRVWEPQAVINRAREAARGYVLMQHPRPSKGYGGAEVDVRKDQHKPKVIGGAMAAVVEAA